MFEKRQWSPQATPLFMATCSFDPEASRAWAPCLLLCASTTRTRHTIDHHPAETEQCADSHRKSDQLGSHARCPPDTPDTSSWPQGHFKNWAGARTCSRPHGHFKSRDCADVTVGHLLRPVRISIDPHCPIQAASKAQLRPKTLTKQKKLV